MEFGEWLCCDVPKKRPHRHFVFSKFRVVLLLELKKLEAIFRHRVLTLLLAKGNIKDEIIRVLLTWRCFGFHVFCGGCISPRDERPRERLSISLSIS
ncbi:MAG: hypothetical protein JRC90_09100 [Deltaproteobacteria bacterium]|nr:hypothetical protein [Deltaproteobacteria bacterium]